MRVDFSKQWRIAQMSEQEMSGAVGFTTVAHLTDDEQTLLENVCDILTERCLDHTARELRALKDRLTAPRRRKAQGYTNYEIGSGGPV